MDVPSDYEARMRSLERECADLRRTVAALYSRRDARVSMPTDFVRTGRLIGTLSQGASADVEEFEFNEDDELEYTGRQHTVWDDMLNQDESIPADTKVKYYRKGGRYIVLVAYCDESDTLPATTASSSSGGGGSSAGTGAGFESFGSEEPSELDPLLELAGTGAGIWPE